MNPTWAHLRAIRALTDEMEIMMSNALGIDQGPYSTQEGL